MLWAEALPSSFAFRSLCAEDALCKSEKVEGRGAGLAGLAGLSWRQLQTVFSLVPEKQNLKQLNFARVLEF